MTGAPDEIPDGLPAGGLHTTTPAELTEQNRELCRSAALNLGQIIGALEVAKLHIWTESVERTDEDD